MNIDINSLFQQAIICIQKNELSEAEKILKKILKFNIEHPDIYLQLGNVLGMQKRFLEALPFHLKATKLAPNRIDILMSLSTTYDEMSKYSDAIQVLEKANTLESNNPLILLGLGKAYFGNGQYQRSVETLENDLSINSNDPRIWFNLGIAQAKLDQIEEAIRSYDHVLRIDPNFPEAEVNKGNVLLQMQNFDLALSSFERAIQIRPEFMNAYIAKAKTLLALNRLTESFETCLKGLEKDANHFEVLGIMGQVLMKFFRYKEASTIFRQILKNHPKNPQAHLDFAESLTHLNQYDEAYAEYKIAYKLNPNLTSLISSLVSTQLRLCDWSDIHKNIQHLLNEIQNSENRVDPFVTLAVADAPQQLLAAKNWSASLYRLPNQNRPPRINANKIRIGYFSADFRTHPVSRLTVGLFELHNRDQFEVIGFATKGAKPDDELRPRVEKAFDQFIDLESTAHQERIKLIQSYDLDIAIDLGGHTQDSAIQLFEYRVAPVQISYIGHPGTTGAPFINYTIGDRLMVPEASQNLYSEKIIYMPDTFQANDSKRESPQQTLTKEELGLNRDTFIFCCFNNSYKINPKMFDVWMRIIQNVPNSVLWILGENPTSQRNLIKEAHLRGVKADALLFASRCGYSEYLARLKAADLFLDTIPFNAGTTASDALWVGLPVLTCLGDAYAGRMAGSLLQAVGLPELITNDLGSYEKLAIEIAKDPSKIQTIKHKLASQKREAPLFNTQLFTLNLEKAYLKIIQRSREGLPPDHIYVE
jgi:predicted O-linked N-acetylglucosamine transferase (SPINDLY family)